MLDCARETAAVRAALAALVWLIFTSVHNPIVETSLFVA
jgi:hypothetical protein